jgi:hypothetical protein
MILCQLKKWSFCNKRMKTFQEYNESSTATFYRLIGGGQFGGAAITTTNQPKIGSKIADVFATPHKEAISTMIEFCLDQGENEDTGEEIKIEDMRVITISSNDYGAPRPGQKTMHWEESDADEVVIKNGKIIKVERAENYL